MAEVDKADAAERLIVAAILMVERGDVPLASHLVATSALGVLRDLMRHDDKEYVTELLKAGMFALAQARANGEAVDLAVPRVIASQVDELAVSIQKVK